MLDAASAARLPAPIAPHHQQEAVLCQRFRAHSSALTSLLILTDTGQDLSRFNKIRLNLPRQNKPFHLIVLDSSKALDVATTLLPCFYMASLLCADDKTEIVTASLDKSVALWSSTVRL
jgi:hypothetical protein